MRDPCDKKRAQLSCFTETVRVREHPDVEEDASAVALPNRYPLPDAIVLNRRGVLHVSNSKSSPARRSAAIPPENAMFRDDERVSVAAVVIRRLLQVASPRGSPFKSDGVVSREHLSSGTIREPISGTQ